MGLGNPSGFSSDPVRCSGGGGGNGVGPVKVPTTPQEYLAESERLSKVIMERLDKLSATLQPVSIESGGRVQGATAPESLNLSPLATMAKINFENMRQISERVCDITDRIQL
jgi:hypothetical protein